MTKHLAISTVLAAALAAGSAYAAGDMDRSAGMQGGGATAGTYAAEQPSNESVRMIQQALQNEGYNVQIDGVYGPNTRQALESFQQRHSSVAQGGGAMGDTQMNQQALTPQDRDAPMGAQGTADRPTADTPITEQLGWDRAGGIRQGAQGEPGSLGGAGRGETGAQ